MNRRGFLTGLSALVAAPAIVRASSIMPVRAYGQSPLMMAISDLDRLNTLLMEALDKMINPPLIVENVHDINQASELVAALPFPRINQLRFDPGDIEAIRQYRAERADWAPRYPGAKLLP